MAKNNIIIGFHSKKICLNISNVLNSYGIKADFICQSGAKLREMATYFGEGVIILGEKFSDEFSINIINDFWQNFNIIFIGNLAQINICEDKKAYKLVTPLKQEELISAIEMQLFKDTPRKIKQNKDKEILNKAKKILFEKYNFTEEKAHKFIQKMSMEKRQKMLETANYIIEKKGDILWKMVL